MIIVSHTWIYKSSLCINKLALLTLLTEWGHSSDHSILLWPPQCGDGTPPGGGHHQHHCTGEIQTAPCHGLKFGVIRFTLCQILPETYIPGSCFCLHQKFCAVWCIQLLINPRRACAARVKVLGLCVCVSVCGCLLLNISLFMRLFVPQTILTFSAADEGRKILSDFPWKCFVAKLECFLLV